jgi:hypothetical protein
MFGLRAGTSLFPRHAQHFLDRTYAGNALVPAVVEDARRTRARVALQVCFGLIDLRFGNTDFFGP